MVEQSGHSSEELLEGFLAVADDATANAIRKVSTAEGYDPSEHALQTFGGAGGQHACGVARRLGMKKIFSPADSGLLSAYGLSRARVERLVERSVLSPIDSQALAQLEEGMIAEGLDAIEKLGQRGRVAGKSAFVRLLGQDVPLEIEYADPVEIESLYRKKFERVFGYFPGGRELEVHSLRMLVAGASPSPEKETFPEAPLRKPTEGALVRDAIEPGERIAGPCLVADDFGTLWIEKGWTACMGTRGSLLLELNECMGSSLSFPAAARRELFASRFLCLVEEMGAQLERTALSVNVRERLDFSCALLDRAGYLVANAPHIPVHLGAMGVCARRLLELFPNLRPGDVLVSNHPAFGGSHLPDVTILAPVFGTGDQPFCFLANRAHHAEIGGVSPGSMPAGTSSLSEEGVVLSLACFSKPENRGWISSANSFAPPLIPPVSPIRIWPTSPLKSRPSAKERKQWRHSSASTGKMSWPNKWTPCVRNHPQVAPSSSRKWANANFRLSKLSMTGTASPFG